MKTLFFLILSLTICCCTYHSKTKDPAIPTTYNTTPYRSANSIGKLRRLVLMPVKLKSYKGRYLTEKDQAVAAAGIADACAQFLIEKKGYEIVIVRDKDGIWQNSLMEDSGYDNNQDLYQTWNKGNEARHTPSVIQKIGGILNVDGVIVIQIKEQKPWGVINGLLNIALMNLPLVYEFAAPDIGAWIYETASGRKVWSKQQSIFGQETIAVTDSLITLFADMENAVPQQLTK